MSRLDSFIRRMEAQRDGLNWAKGELAAMPGPVFEFGLGNGRTYDHLRVCFPGRSIYVLDREMRAHPECVPPADHMLLGEFAQTLPKAARDWAGKAALVHADIGSSNKQASLALAAWAAPYWVQLLQKGGLVICDQPVKAEGLQIIELPQGPERSACMLKRI